MHKPQDPQFAERIRASFGRQQAMRLIGASMPVIEPSASTLTSHETGVLTVEYKLNLLTPAEGQLLIAEGSVIRYGRTLIVTRADVFAINDGSKTQCAVMQQTIMTLHGKKDNVL